MDLEPNVSIEEQTVHYANECQHVLALDLALHASTSLPYITAIACLIAQCELAKITEAAENIKDFYGYAGPCKIAETPELYEIGERVRIASQFIQQCSNLQMLDIDLWPSSILRSAICSRASTLTELELEHPGEGLVLHEKDVALVVEGLPALKSFVWRANHQYERISGDHSLRNAIAGRSRLVILELYRCAAVTDDFFP